MDIFEKLAEFSNETFSALKWIFLFVSCSAFFASLLALKPSKKDVSKAVTFRITARESSAIQLPSSSLVPFLLLLQRAGLCTVILLIWYVN